MDAPRIIFVIVASFVALTVSVPVMPDTEPLEMGLSTETEASPTTFLPPPTAPPAPRNCATARREDGVCAQRQYCDHSTGPIDRSLYKPSWYASSCMDDEVCCPFQAIIQNESKPDGNYEEDFNDDNF